VIAHLGDADLDRFRGIIARRLGLQFDDAKLGLLADVLHRRVEASGQSPDAYLWHLESARPASGEPALLARDLTVTETYFFRNREQLRALTESALPSLASPPTGGRPLRILSAGCASGEEAYSLAIALREATPELARGASIQAVDVNPAALEQARRARYSAWSLRDTPAETRTRWFRAHGREFLLDAAVREAVVFEERNLIDEHPDFWQPNAFDVVFCRNVLMYFVPESAQALVGRIARALVPGGYLFLGHAETLRGLSQDFHLRHTHSTFYYQLKTAAERSAGPEAATAALSTLPSPAPLPALVGESESWVDTIRRAADRIQALADGPSPPDRSGHSAGVEAAKPAWDLSGSRELLRQERFGAALELLQALPPESAGDPEVLLLRAALLAHSGQLARAEALSRELIERDELNSGGHYVLALCREGAGDRAAAVEHDRIASYLDPSFAMPRLHLGLLARRDGDPAAASRAFEEALALLQKEDASRMLLFGGGFSRGALIALCRAQIAACGGRP